MKIYLGINNLTLLAKWGFIFNNLYTKIDDIYINSKPIKCSIGCVYYDRIKEIGNKYLITERGFIIVKIFNWEFLACYLNGLMEYIFRTTESFNDLYDKYITPKLLNRNRKENWKLIDNVAKQGLKINV